MNKDKVKKDFLAGYGLNLNYEKNDISKSEFCKTKGCERSNYKGGFCKLHYENILKFDRTKLCSIKDCNEKHHAKGYCKSHYNEFCNKKKRFKKIIFS